MGVAAATIIYNDDSKKVSEKYRNMSRKYEKNKVNFHEETRPALSFLTQKKG